MNGFKEYILPKIKQVPIVEYARRMGLTPVRSGRTYYLKEHDSVVLRPVENNFWRNLNGAHGDVIDFAQEVLGLSYREAIQSLLPFTDGLPAPPNQKKQIPRSNPQLILPPKSDRIDVVWHYLVDKRQVDPRVVQLYLDRGMLYQQAGAHPNCVWVGYDEKGHPCYCCYRGTIDFPGKKKYRGDVQGCDYSKGIALLHPGVQTLVVGESAISTMSAMSNMLREGRSLTKYSYLILGGATKVRAVRHYLSPPITTIVMAMDNDAAGHHAIASVWQMLQECRWPGRLMKYLPSVPGWDWNDQIKSGGTTT